MTESILDSIKGLCNMEPDYTEFDKEMVLYINSELAVLNQIGIGPAAGLQIEDSIAVWDDLLEGEMRLNMVKTYMGLKVRLVFDPPQTGPLTAAIEKQADMLLWRIRELREEKSWTAPPVTVVSSPDS